MHRIWFSAKIFTYIWRKEEVVYILAYFLWLDLSINWSDLFSWSSSYFRKASRISPYNSDRAVLPNINSAWLQFGMTLYNLTKGLMILYNRSTSWKYLKISGISLYPRNMKSNHFRNDCILNSMIKKNWYFNVSQTVAWWPQIIIVFQIIQHIIILTKPSRIVELQIVANLFRADLFLKILDHFGKSFLEFLNDFSRVFTNLRSSPDPSNFPHHYSIGRKRTSYWSKVQW